MVTLGLGPAAHAAGYDVIRYDSRREGPAAHAAGYNALPYGNRRSPARERRDRTRRFDQPVVHAAADSHGAKVPLLTERATMLLVTATLVALRVSAGTTVEGSTIRL